MRWLETGLLVVSLALLIVVAALVRTLAKTVRRQSGELHRQTALLDEMYKHTTSTKQAVSDLSTRLPPRGNDGRPD